MDFEFEELEKINAYMQSAFIEETISQEECLREIQDVISYSKKIKRSKSWEGIKKLKKCLNYTTHYLIKIFLLQIAKY